jgi:hypothetical protein
MGLVSIAACVEPDETDEQTAHAGDAMRTDLAFRMRREETIVVHSCSPGFVEVGEGDNATCMAEPGWGWGGGIRSVGGERVPSGPASEGPGHGTPPVGRPVMGQPGVTLYTFDLGKWICISVCATMSYTICRAVEVACAVGSTFTLGGMVLPCAGAIPTACLAGIFGSAACSELFCDDKK